MLGARGGSAARLRGSAYADQRQLLGTARYNLESEHRRPELNRIPVCKPCALHGLTIDRRAERGAEVQQ